MKPMLASELQEVLSKAYSACGNRPVFVEINGRRFFFNDLQFSIHGKEYLLILRDEEEEE